MVYDTSLFKNELRSVMHFEREEVCLACILAWHVNAQCGSSSSFLRWWNNGSNPLLIWWPGSFSRYIKNYLHIIFIDERNISSCFKILMQNLEAEKGVIGCPLARIQLVLAWLGNAGRSPLLHACKQMKEKRPRLHAWMQDDVGGYRQSIFIHARSKHAGCLGAVGRATNHVLNDIYGA